MEANLEKQKNDLVRKKADNESKLKDLDEKILRMLQETKGQLIDDLDLIKALQIAKETEEGKIILKTSLEFYLWT